MSILPILQYPDPVLRAPCARLDRFDAEMRALAEDMLATMYESKGRGLAAPQVGRSIQLFVMDAGWKTGTKAPLICANPHIAALDDEVRACEEVCLSIPVQPTTVTRPARVLLRWHDLFAEPHELELGGEAAVIAQHEADHLEGRLCIDYAEAA